MYKYTMLTNFIRILDKMLKEAKLDPIPDYTVEFVLFQLLSHDFNLAQDTKWLRDALREGVPLQKPAGVSSLTRDLIADLELHPTIKLLHAKDFVLLARANRGELVTDLIARGWVFNDKANG